MFVTLWYEWALSASTQVQMKSFSIWTLHCKFIRKKSSGNLHFVNSQKAYLSASEALVSKVEAPIMDMGPIVEFIFKSHTFLKHVSMKVINNCLKLKLSKIGSSSLGM